MAKLDVVLRQYEKIILYGVWSKSNDKAISKDIPRMSEEYYKILGMENILPFYVLSKNYDEKTKDFEIFIGSTKENSGLEKFTLTEGEYAKITVKPKLGFIWGLSVGEAKQFFYTEWLDKSNYLALNMEYEYHTEKSIGKSPTIDIVFAVKKR